MSVEGKLGEIKKIWDNATEAQTVDYVGNGDWIELLNEAVLLLPEAAAEFQALVPEIKDPYFMEIYHNLAKEGDAAPMVKFALAVEKWFGAPKL